MWFFGHRRKMKILREKRINNYAIGKRAIYQHLGCGQIKDCIERIISPMPAQWLVKRFCNGSCWANFSQEHDMHSKQKFAREVYHEWCLWVV